MKSENFILVSEAVKINACLRIKDIIADGKTKITISNAGGRSIKQNSLLWLWNTEVAKSGKGSYDEKEAVHRSVKQRWVIPILIRDDGLFADLYRIWAQLYKGNMDRMNWFVDNQVSSATLTTHQMAEVLTEYQRFYAGHGVELTNPDDLKLLYYERDHAKD